MNIKEIIEGWHNKLIPPEQLKELINSTSQERMDICRNCIYNSKVSPEKALPLRFDEHCTDCGCTLSAKTKCLSCSCELENPKWKAVLSKKQEDELPE